MSRTELVLSVVVIVLGLAIGHYVTTPMHRWIVGTISRN